MASWSRDAAVNTLLNNLRVVAFSVYFLAGHFRPRSAEAGKKDPRKRKKEEKNTEGEENEERASLANARSRQRARMDDERVSINRFSSASHRAIPVTRNSVRCCEARGYEDALKVFSTSRPPGTEGQRGREEDERNYRDISRPSAVHY